MDFVETKLKGAYIIEIKKFEDTRGFFARGWCQREFEEHGLVSCIAQANISVNLKRVLCAAYIIRLFLMPKQS